MLLEIGKHRRRWLDIRRPDTRFIATGGKVREDRDVTSLEEGPAQTPGELTTMTQRMDIEIVGRRTFLLGAGASLAIATFLANLSALGPALAQEPIRSLDEALKKVLGDAKPVESGITLEVPEIAENGNTVPFALSVESPMTAESYVKTLHIFASGNPQVGVASYSFTPASGKAAVSSRMRLARTQDIVAVAELSDGKFLLGKRGVKVTIGGCGG
jgi:sulfur-oxidizing protein SoxY